MNNRIGCYEDFYLYFFLFILYHMSCTQEMCL